jgi:hypothetical protein
MLFVRAKAGQRWGSRNTPSWIPVRRVQVDIAVGRANYMDKGKYAKMEQMWRRKKTRQKNLAVQ